MGFFEMTLGFHDYPESPATPKTIVEKMGENQTAAGPVPKSLRYTKEWPG
jgi:hypothetical protein